MFSVSFNGVESWGDLALVPTVRPAIAPPEIKTNFVEIPGGNGSLDLTEALTGEPTFSDRIGSIEFIVLRRNMSMMYFYEREQRLIDADVMLSILLDREEGRAEYIDVRVPGAPDPVWVPDESTQMYWCTRYQDILNRVHGKKGPMIYSEDPEYFYKARYSVSGWTTDDSYSTVTINYRASPFKYPIRYLDLYYSRELEQYGVL